MSPFVAAANLDLLQLDYRRSRTARPTAGGDVALADFADGVRSVIGELARSLYLDSQLHIVTNAGWSDAYGCAEMVAAELLARGCGAILVSAVRGSNLAPLLETLMLEGVDLRNSETGAPWQGAFKTVWGADIHLGAPPLARAIGEGARVTIAGSYDGVSPLLGYALHAWGWAPSDYRRLAAASVAARACHAPAWGWEAPQGAGERSRNSDSWPAPIADLQEDGSLTLHTGGPADELTCRRVTQWLQKESQRAWGDGRADVCADLGSLKAATWYGAMTLEHAEGSAPTGAWNVEIHYQTGYSAAALAVARPSDRETQRELGSWLQSRLAPWEDLHGTLVVRPLQEQDSATALYLCELRTTDWEACELFAAEAQRTIMQSHGALSWAGSPPVVVAECGVWPTSIPRDAVDYYVDTRPAAEWV